MYMIVILEKEWELRKNFEDKRNACSFNDFEIEKKKKKQRREEILNTI